MGYLGDNESTWEEYDAVVLMKAYKGVHLPLLVDFGSSDPFLENQLCPDALKEACQESGYSVTIRMQVTHFGIFVCILQHLLPCPINFTALAPTCMIH